MANTPSDLAQGIAPAMLKGRVAKKVAFERVQMTRLLEALAQTSILQYPVQVKHTTDHVPDFRLALSGRGIGVELTRIKFQDIEHGRALQERGLTTTLVTSSLHPKESGPRKKQEIINDGFGIPPMVFPLSAEEEDRVWLKQAKESLDAKTVVVLRNDFDHGDEDWLVVVDSVGAIDSEVRKRKEGFSQLLASFWKSGWFTRVFLQDNFFRWQMMFVPSKSIILPRYNE